jgi:6-pyruvoyl-tetrahydropterin synthase
MIAAGLSVQKRAMYTIYRCFSDTAVNFSIRSLGSDGNLDVSVVVDLLDHEVYMVDYYNAKDRIVFRWVDSDYMNAFNKELFDLQEDPTETQLGRRIVNITKYNLLSALEAHVSSLTEEDNDNEDYETISLDLTDSELALIARAAHVKDVTINEFINEAVKVKLDEWEKNCLNYDQNVL